MRQVRWASLMVGTAMLAVCGVRPAVADIRSDQAAAILEWPSVLFAEADVLPGSLEVLETVIQMSNTSDTPVSVWCFYENANSHCSNNGFVCLQASDCCDSMLGCGVCTPGWNETDFRINLTPRQPAGWLVSEGLAGFDGIPPKAFNKFALSGIFPNVGIGGSSNAGSRVPPVPESPFNGALRCIAVDEDGIPVDRNVLKGESTLEFFADGTGDDFDVVQVAKSNAIGIQAIEGAVNDDKVLTLGGPEPEYNGCPNYLILNHFFDGAENPAIPDGYDSGPAPILTVLTLVPCSQDYLRQKPGGATVQYLVFNEFEQRISTSKGFNCKFVSLISNIDTPQNERSIWFVGNQGTLTGQTRINGVQGGILGVATEIYDLAAIADFNLHYQGDRTDPDFIILP